MTPQIRLALGAFALAGLALSVPTSGDGPLGDHVPPHLMKRDTTCNKFANAATSDFLTQCKATLDTLDTLDGMAGQRCSTTPNTAKVLCKDHATNMTVWSESLTTSEWAFAPCANVSYAIKDIMDRCKDLGLTGQGAAYDNGYVQVFVYNPTDVPSATVQTVTVVDARGSMTVKPTTFTFDSASLMYTGPVVSTASVQSTSSSSFTTAPAAVKRANADEEAFARRWFLDPGSIVKRAGCAGDSNVTLDKNFMTACKDELAKAGDKWCSDFPLSARMLCQSADGKMSVISLAQTITSWAMASCANVSSAIQEIMDSCDGAKVGQAGAFGNGYVQVFVNAGPNLLQQSVASVGEVAGTMVTTSVLETFTTNLSSLILSSWTPTSPVANSATTTATATATPLSSTAAPVAARDLLAARDPLDARDPLADPGIMKRDTLCHGQYVNPDFVNQCIDAIKATTDRNCTALVPVAPVLCVDTSGIAVWAESLTITQYYHANTSDVAYALEDILKSCKTEMGQGAAYNNGYVQVFVHSTTLASAFLTQSVFFAGIRTFTLNTSSIVYSATYNAGTIPSAATSAATTDRVVAAVSPTPISGGPWMSRSTSTSIVSSVIVLSPTTYV